MGALVYDTDTEIEFVVSNLRQNGATWLEIEHALWRAAEKARRAYERSEINDHG